MLCCKNENERRTYDIYFKLSYIYRRGKREGERRRGREREGGRGEIKEKGSYMYIIEGERKKEGD